MGIEIRSLMIPWYGLFIVLGIAAGAILGCFLIRRNHMEFDDFIQIACFVGLGAMVGGNRLYRVDRCADRSTAFYGAGSRGGRKSCDRGCTVSVWENMQ